MRLSFTQANERIPQLLQHAQDYHEHSVAVREAYARYEALQQDIVDAFRRALLFGELTLGRYPNDFPTEELRGKSVPDEAAYLELQKMLAQTSPSASK